MDLTNLLASNNYIIVNKILIKELGLEEAILFGELASEYSYWKDREKLEDDYFFSTMENIEKNTCLSSYKQRKLIEKLKNEGLISTKIQGIPAKRYIKINEEQVIKKLNIKLLKNLTSSSKKNEQLDVEKFNTNNNNINNNKLKNNNNNNNINIYIQNDTIPYEEIINYLNLKANKNFRHNIKKTRSLIQARFNEGFTLDDFKIVIDKKCKEWLKTEFEKYLRPETLFSNKFEGYLNQTETQKEMSKSARQLKILEGLANGTIDVL